MSTFVIAEAGVNHNGDPNLALQLVDVAAEAGADAVKFQTFRADSLATETAPTAAYQRIATGNEVSQRAMLRQLELDAETHGDLVRRCRERKIAFLSTPFDLDSLALLTDRLGLDTLKVSSGDLTNGPLLLAAAQAGRDVILSTGMSTLDEVREALGVLAFGYAGDTEAPSRAIFSATLESAEGQAALNRHVTLLHCTTEYPASVEDTNLRAMATMRDAFRVRVGLSDHTLGIAVPIAAAALGASVIEKHFTLDRQLPGPDHQASLEPDELRAMIAGIRDVEQALGDGIKTPRPAELCNRDIVRKSLVAARDIRKGEIVVAADLEAKRPGTGASPMEHWDRIGKKAKRDVAEGKQL